ncbi:hypothetical protein Tco_1238777 [Tanacetum coccineum]
MVYVVNGVPVSGVDIILKKDFVCFALQKMEIHPLIFDQPPQYSIDHQPQEDLNQQSMDDVYNKWDNMIESRNELLQTLGKILRQREQAANLSTHTLEPSRHFNSIYYDDDDDDDYEESTIPLNEMFPQDLCLLQSHPHLLVTPLFDANEDECFDPGGEFDEIEACLTSNSISPEIDDADFDPEGDILLLEKLLSDDTSPLPPKELHFEVLR